MVERENFSRFHRGPSSTLRCLLGARWPMQLSELTHTSAWVGNLLLRFLVFKLYRWEHSFDFFVGLHDTAPSSHLARWACSIFVESLFFWFVSNGIFLLVYFVICWVAAALVELVNQMLRVQVRNEGFVTMLSFVSRGYNVRCSFVLRRAKVLTKHLPSPTLMVAKLCLIRAWSGCFSSGLRLVIKENICGGAVGVWWPAVCSKCVFVMRVFVLLKSSPLFMELRFVGFVRSAGGWKRGCLLPVSHSAWWSEFVYLCLFF